MIILGISCFYHDSSVCLIKDGEIISAVQEERFSRIKHDWRFPEKAIKYSLQDASVEPQDIEAIVFYEKPFLKFERILETFLSVAPRGYLSFIDIMPSWLKKKLWIPVIIEKELNYKGKILFSQHHLSHAASSFFLSPFEESAILTIDGVGEWATASYGYGKGNRIYLQKEMRFPDSLGLLYSTFTAYLGFEVNDGEYKVMGMAPYGNPVYYSEIKEKLLQINHDGSIKLNMDYFSFQYGKKMFNKRFEKLFGLRARKKDEPLEQKHFDIAASIQKIIEDVILKMAFHVYKETKMKNLCLAGGVSLNCVANSRILNEGPFENIFIQPASGDAGGAIGAAYVAYHHYFNQKDRHPLKSLYLGPSFTEKQIIDSFLKYNVEHKKLNIEDLIQITAKLLSEGKVIGWFQGRMEFGPRALGNRSILADPRRPEMKDIVNKRVKFRETYRPFAPSVTFEDIDKYFEIKIESPYMLFVAKVKSDKIPAVTHVDNTARLQTLKRQDNPLFYDLLKAFEKITGIPVLLNTSFNLKGEPIVCTPEDAVKTFLKSGLDYLIIGNFIASKKNPGYN